MPVNLFAQDHIAGRYRDYFGSLLNLNADSTFKYTWHFDLQSSWTKGTWTLKNDTLYINMVPTYDTVSLFKSDKRTVDSLIMSIDEIPERLTQAEFNGIPLYAGGQNRMSYPVKLLLKKGRLYKIQKGRLVNKKQKGFWPNKKWNPWYFKSDD